MPFDSRFTKPPNAIAMLRLSAVGDICHTVPVLRALQDQWPETTLTWVVGSVEAPLIDDIEGAEFIRFDKKAGLRALFDLQQQMRGRRYDALLHMQIALRSSAASMVIPARRHIGFDRIRARNFQWMFTRDRIPAWHRQHVMEGLLAFAKHLGADTRHPRWDIPIPAEAANFARQYLPDGQPGLVLSPCSSQRVRNFRNWRPERYAAVIDYAAAEHGLTTLITGGPTAREQAMTQAILAHCQSRPVDLVGKTSLKQLFALIARARAVICPDSGPAHMSTAAGTPVIGLYASSNPDRTGPYLSRKWCVNKYPEALKAETGKTVDQVRWGARVRDPKVMDRISVADVVDRLDALMASGIA